MVEVVIFSGRLNAQLGFDPNVCGEIFTISKWQPSTRKVQNLLLEFGLPGLHSKYLDAISFMKVYIEHD